MSQQDDAWTQIFDLAEAVTGQTYTPQQRSGILKNNLNRRVRQIGLQTVADYMAFLNGHEDEWSRFVSLFTIHTTSWFREEPHFHKLMSELATWKGGGPFRVLCAACSTGQEVYSVALVLESYRRQHPGFEYVVEGFDIDPISVDVAKEAVYPKTGFPKNHWDRHKSLLMVGEGRWEGMFTLVPEIKNRVKLAVGDITSPPLYTHKFDYVFCRNVLIYFSKEQVQLIIALLRDLLSPTGRLCIGHSEVIDAEKLGMKLLGSAIYAKSDHIISGGPESSVVAARDGDVLLRGLDLIVIGASTGGTTALVDLLLNLPKPCPPFVVVQHITPHFSKAFFERLAQQSGLKPGSCLQGTPLEADTLYMSGGDFHIGVLGDGGTLRLKTSNEALVSSHRPSVDYLFSSVASLRGKRILAILMTGMGEDGAQGLLKLKKAGAFTACQDEQSSVVFGMPREAIRLNAACAVGNIHELRLLIEKGLGIRRETQSAS